MNRVTLTAALLATATSALSGPAGPVSPRQSAQEWTPDDVGTVSYQDFGVTDEDVAEFFATDTVRGVVGGRAHIGEAHATIELPAAMRLLDKRDTRRLLEVYWSNAEDTTVLGSIVPAGAVLMDEIEWAFVIGHSDQGHVSEADADEMNYDAVLADLQEQSRSIGEEMASMGYPRQELLGWAKAPTYDKRTKVLTWAKRCKFTYPDGEEDETMNYDCIFLSRHGYLTLQAISSMDEAKSVMAKGDELSGRVSFDPGHRYEDFDINSEALGYWTVGGLVANTPAVRSDGIMDQMGTLIGQVMTFVIAAIVLAAVVVILLLRKRRRGDNGDGDDDA